MKARLIAKQQYAGSMEHQEIANLFGVTKQRIQQIEQAALRKLWRKTLPRYQQNRELN